VIFCSEAIGPIIPPAGRRVAVDIHNPVVALAGQSGTTALINEAVRRYRAQHCKAVVS
jgi:hypothetical protein